MTRHIKTRFWYREAITELSAKEILFICFVDWVFNIYQGEYRGTEKDDLILR